MWPVGEHPLLSSEHVGLSWMGVGPGLIVHTREGGVIQQFLQDMMWVRVRTTSVALLGSETSKRL